MGSRILTATAIAGVLGLAAGAAGAMLLGERSGPADGDDGIASSIIGAPDGAVLAAGLVQPTDCADLAASMRALADEYGWHGAGWMGGGELLAFTADADQMAEESTDAGFAPEAGGAADGAALESDNGGGFDATNVQEIGVDEPDLVERIGADLVVVGTEGALRLVDTSSGVPVQRGTLQVQEQWGGDLGLLSVGPDRIAVLSQAESPVRDVAGSLIRPGGWSTTVVTLVDVSDPDAPRELSRMEVEGWLVDARAVGGVLRLAVRSEGPQVDVAAMGEFEADREMDFDSASEQDVVEYERRYQEEYERRMAEALDQLEPAHWQPHVSVDGRTRPLVDCDAIGFPTGFSGLGTLTIAAVDTADGTLRLDDAEAVVTGGETLYATTDRVVVATNRWDVQPLPTEPVDPDPAPEPTFLPEGEAPAPPPVDPEPLPVEPEPLPAPTTKPLPDGDTDADDPVEVEVLPMVDIARPGTMPFPGGASSTDLHVFDVEGAVVSHVASGNVAGNLINQYAMSIHDGVLRTATTAWDDTGRTESLVTTFRVEGTDLVRLGQVGDLGPDEDIQAVRFMGTTAYVVTFRRTDPLYVVDLSDPRAPRTRGELKIEGYSAYLHPLGAGQLLGVGQDADPATGITRGVQVSTFDVTDPTAPARIDVDVTPDSNSEVEWEPHALTVTDEREAIVPVEIWDPTTPQGQLGALVYEIGADGRLVRRGLLSVGGDWQLRPRRSIDMGDVLLTVGDRGVVAWDGVTLTAIDTLRFDAPAFEQGFEEDFGEGPGGGEPGFDPAG